MHSVMKVAPFFCIHFSGHGQCIFETDHELTRGENSPITQNLEFRILADFSSVALLFDRIVHFTSSLRHILVRETMLDLDSLSSSWGSDSVEAPIYASTIKLRVPGSKGEQQPRCRSRPVLACEFEVQTKSH